MSMKAQRHAQAHIRTPNKLKVVDRQYEYESHLKITAEFDSKPTQRYWGGRIKRTN